MKKKMYGEIQANLPIAQSPSLATLRLFLLQAGGWALMGSAVGSFSESIAKQSPCEYALQGLTPPGFSGSQRSRGGGTRCQPLTKPSLGASMKKSGTNESLKL